MSPNTTIFDLFSFMRHLVARGKKQFFEISSLDFFYHDVWAFPSRVQLKILKLEFLSKVICKETDDVLN